MDELRLVTFPDTAESDGLGKTAKLSNFLPPGAPARRSICGS